MKTRLRCAALLLAASVACGRGDLESPDPASRARAVRALRGANASLAALLVAERDASPVVRRAAADAFAARGGPEAADALGKLLVDPVPEVAVAAAAGLGAMPSEPRARQRLVQAYADATPSGRAAIADALDHIGVSLREAIDAEARTLWERSLAVLERGGGAARAGAAEEAGASARTEAVQRLVPLVIDPKRNQDRLLAAAAARGLGESGDGSARLALETILGGSDPFLAETAATALGRLGNPAAADALAAAALADPGRVANAAGEALAALPEAPEVGVALCDLAIRSPDPVLAARSAREARRRDATCPSRPLLARLGKTGTLTALAAFGELGLPRDVAAGAAEKIAPLLDPARSRDPEIRIAAARALGGLAATSSAPAVLRRAQALSAQIGEERTCWIAGTPPPSAPARWVDGVSSVEARELGALLAVAGRLRADGVQSLLASHAHDPQPAVRSGVVEGLARAGAGQALDVAAAALEDADPAVRSAAAEALSGLGGRGAPALAQAVRVADPSDGAWRSVLARALGECGSAQVVPVLAGLLEGASAASAAAALARIGSPAGVPPLVEYLARPEAPARADAIEALAQLAARDAAPAIAALLTDDRPEIRAAAVHALGLLRHEPASPRLEALRSDYYGRVRRAAVEALAKLPAGTQRPRR